MNESPSNICGIGVLVRDITVQVARPPGPDEKVPAQAFVESGGGPVPTALVAARRLGSRVAFGGVVGRDASGAFLREDLSREGVEITALREDAAFTTPVSVITASGARRSVVEVRQDPQLPDSESLTEALGPRLEACALLLVDGRFPCAQAAAAERVHAAGGAVMLDAGHPRPGVDALLPHVDIALLSHSYPAALALPRAAWDGFLRELLERLAPGPRRLAGLTLGQDGCVLLDQAGGVRRHAAVPVEALDTTGAGDVFHGAFAHGLVRGLSVDDAARFAAAAASAKCRGLTGRAPLPAAAELARSAGVDLG